MSLRTGPFASWLGLLVLFVAACASRCGAEDTAPPTTTTSTSTTTGGSISAADEQDRFWAIVGVPSTSDDEARAAAIEHRLSARTVPEVVLFDAILRTQLARSYTVELWGACYLVQGGCSDDGFEYFRLGLIVEGRAVYEAALRDPESIAALPEPRVTLEHESLAYVANLVHRAKTGMELPADGIRVYPPIKERWDFDNAAEMKRRYPKLWARFGDK